MKKSVSFLLVSLVIGSLFVATPASARGRDVRRSGGCSGASNWKLKLGGEDAGIDVEFEVDQNVNGEEWRVILKHDGDRFFSGKRTTKAPSGSFQVNRTVNDSAGEDKIVARAHNLSTDEICRGTATF